MAYVKTRDYAVGEGTSYRGPAEICYFTYDINQPDQFINQSKIDELVDASITSVEAHDGTILQVTLFEDTAATWSTRYQVAITSHSNTPAEEEGIGLFWVLFGWGVFVLVVGMIASLVIWMIAALVKAVASINFTGMAKAIGAFTWLLIIGAGLLIVGGLFTASGRGRYEAGEQWVKGAPRRWRGGSGGGSKITATSSAPSAPSTPRSSGRHILDNE